jgi:hypothetical protein
VAKIAISPLQESFKDDRYCDKIAVWIAEKGLEEVHFHIFLGKKDYEEN